MRNRKTGQVTAHKIGGTRVGGIHATVNRDGTVSFHNRSWASGKANDVGASGKLNDGPKPNVGSMTRDSVLGELANGLGSGAPGWLRR